jgi:hypothetical protein
MEYEICEKTGKRCYSLKDAQYTVNQATRKHFKNTIKNVPKRVYYCRSCRAYHLTKEKAKYDGNKKRNQLSTRYSNERRRIERMEEDIYRYSREYR